MARAATDAKVSARDARQVLLLGATGRTGGRVLRELLARGVTTCVIVRSAARLPQDLLQHAALTVIEARLLDLPRHELARHLAGCDAAISCLGHTISLRGAFGPPRDLVARAVHEILAAARDQPREAPLRMVLMGSVSVHHRASTDGRRGPLERLLLAVLRAVLPPARDNQRAADLLLRATADSDAHVVGVVVRPDTLKEGAVSPYEIHDALVASLFRPATTRMANAAHFMATLATEDVVWTRWRGAMPVVVDATSAASGVEASGVEASESTPRLSEPRQRVTPGRLS